MKKRFWAALLAIFMTLSASPIIGYAQTPPGGDSTSSSDVSEQTNDFEIQDSSSSDFQTKLEERLNERREKLQSKLSAAEKARFVAKCKLGQTAISSVADKAKEAKNSRDKAYSNIITKVNNLTDKLKTNNNDTTKLEANVKELESLIDTFKTDLLTFRQAIEDIKSMNCTENPNGFKATIDEMRAAREKLTADSQSIRVYVNETLKVTLQEIRDTVDQAKEETN